MAKTTNKFDILTKDLPSKARPTDALSSQNLNCTLAVASLDKNNQLRPKVVPLFVVQFKNNKILAINLQKLPPKHQIFLLNAAKEGKTFDKRSVLRLMQDFHVKKATETHNFDKFTYFLPVAGNKSDEIVQILNATM